MESKIASIPAPYATQHIDTQGPGDGRPTALQIVEDQKLVGKLQGRVCFITRCTSGIGVETARALHATGADVYFTARDVARGQKVAQDIKSSTSAAGVIEPIQMELDSLESVRVGTEKFLSKSQKLNLLINNAGIMATPEGTTKDGFESQFGTNFLGHFLLFKLLESALLASTSPELASRVVSVSSSGHLGGEIYFDDYSLKNTGYTPWKAYGQSKLANVYLANEIERRYGDKGLHAWSLMPGGIDTGLQVHVQDSIDAAKEKPEVVRAMKSIPQGAATTIWAALAKELEGKGGVYLEDCAAAELVGKNKSPVGAGYDKRAYDEKAATRLWDNGLKMIGIE